MKRFRLGAIGRWSSIFLRDARGSMATDYALIAAILVLVVIGAVNALSGGIGELFQDISSGLGGTETE